MNTNEINSEKTIENDSVGATATSVREEAPVFSVILIQKKVILMWWCMCVHVRHSGMKHIQMKNARSRKTQSLE